MEAKELFEMLNKYAESKVDICKRKPGEKFDFSEELLGFNMEWPNKVIFLIQGSQYDSTLVREEFVPFEDILEWYESYRLAVLCFGDEDE